jgi:uncharacterized protein YndB with AHSA1/START domain
MTDARNAEPTWSLDREIVLTRVLDAPRELVYRAWTDPEHIQRWFGPKDFTCTTHAIDMRVGGMWRFDMVGPAGQRYPNRMTFLQMKAPELLVFDHCGDTDHDPRKFRVTITFDSQSNGKTVVTMRQLHPTKAHREAGISFGAVEIGNTTMDKLEAHVRNRYQEQPARG